jgi:NTE family protein
MKRFPLFILLLFMAVSTATAQNVQRPKVAVVLSGGGAKGVAHISALKVIEEAGIPIDMVVGTSMGSLIGGLYCVGYRPEQIDSMVRVQDWRFLLSDDVKRSRMTFISRQRSSRYLLSRQFTSRPKDMVSGGLIKGRNLEQLFSQLIHGYTDSLNFDSLPIPFACVATDIASNDSYVFHNGSLYTAMRSSMSIPGVFEPIRKDSMVLVDGGVVNNFPVDVARSMGADYVIGVSLQGPRRSYDQIESVSSVINQISEIADAQRYKDNMENTDVLIHVDVKGYGAASFKPDAIDTLIRRGDEAARGQWDNLLALRRKLSIDSTAKIHRFGPFPVWRDSLLNTRFEPDALDSNSVNLGLRFDTEELAALLLNANLMLPTKVSSQGAFTLRLGRHSFGKLDFLCHTARFGHLDISYQLEYNDMDIYYKGSRAYNTTYFRHVAETGFWGSWHTVRVGIGLRYEHYHYTDFLAKNAYQLSETPHHEGYLSYFGNLQFDNFNRRTFPTRGMRWQVQGSLYTTNFVRYQDHTPILALMGMWEGAYRIKGRRLTLLPFFHARALMEHELPYSLSTFIGGQYFGRSVPQQMPFMGIGNVQMGSDVTGVGGFKLRQRLGHSNYVTLVANYGFLADKESGGKYNCHNIYGAGLTYSYDSLIGPVEGTISYSNRTKKVSLFVNIGYFF